MLIANNCTRESGSFCGDQLCSLKTAYLFAEHAPPGTDKFIMSVSPGNEMHFLWTKFIEKYDVKLIIDDWNPGDWRSRWEAWDKWRTERSIAGIPFDHYRELHLRVWPHGEQRQTLLCGSERGLGKRNIYQYWWCGQEGAPEELPLSVDWFDGTLIHHPPHKPVRDVYISPHAKTQGNTVFTFDFWSEVVHKLIDAGVSVTVGYDNCCGPFCEDLNYHPLYRKHWGTHEQWMEQICSHKLVACGNTGTGWLAAACGVPMITMEPPNSQMADHRYRECGLKNIVEIVSTPYADYVARRIVEIVGGSLKALDAHNIVRQAAPHSINHPDKLKLVATYLLSVSDVPGDMADLGAYHGGVSYLMRHLEPHRYLYVVDTWEGNPHNDDLCHHKRGEWKASMEACKHLVGNGDETYYLKGIFPKSVDWLYYRDFCFVYVDMDSYQSTKDAITFFWPRMSPGGIIMFDDWKWDPCAGVEKAVTEAFSKDQIVDCGHNTCLVKK
jgi:hypothetical protein